MSAIKVAPSSSQQSIGHAIKIDPRITRIDLDYVADIFGLGLSLTILGPAAAWYFIFLVCRFSPSRAKNAGALWATKNWIRTYAVGVLSPRQSGTFHFSCVQFSARSAENCTQHDR